MKITNRYLQCLWLGIQSLVDYFALTIAVTIIFLPLMLLANFHETLGMFTVPIAVLYAIFVGTPLLGAYLPPLIKSKQNIFDKKKE